MAFGTVGFGGLAKSLFTVVTDATMFILAVRILRHLQVFLFHLEDFGVAIGAFCFMLVHMGFVAEENRSGAPLGFKFNVPATRFFLLGIGDAEYREAQDAKADHYGFPDSFPQIFTPFHCRIRSCIQTYTGNFI